MSSQPPRHLTLVLHAVLYSEPDVFPALRLNALHVPTVQVQSSLLTAKVVSLRPVLTPTVLIAMEHLVTNVFNAKLASHSLLQQLAHLPLAPS
jgi:hypothetical protein